MAKYRKKPMVIEAERFYPLDYYNGFKIDGVIRRKNDDEPEFYINTLEGKMECKHGDYIIKGVANEFYPCKPNIFEKTYEKFN